MAALLAQAWSSLAAQRYVDVNSANPTAPYANWASAARVIQDAVDVANPGDEILVTNGIYSSGGRAIGMLTNRVAITKPLTLRSVNGAEFTIIRGYQLPAELGGPVGDSAIRCVYLTHGATLSGFTLTNGATRISSETDQSEWSGGGLYCESQGAVVSNCVVTANSAFAGGGVFGGTLYYCTVESNSADYGGGTYETKLNGSTLRSNSAAFGLGGGALGGTLRNCAVNGNTAYQGGGVYGWNGATLVNCTITGNSAWFAGGGVIYSTLTNCIVFYNTASFDGNYQDSTLDYCYTTPLPPTGTGSNNMDAEPALVSASHLSADSPCLGQGIYGSVSGVDIDGEPWRSPPAVGCDEYVIGSNTGMLAVAMVPFSPTVAGGVSVNLQALISGRANASRGELDDGTAATNRPFLSRVWNSPGDYPVILRAFNQSYPAGVMATAMVHVVNQPVHYVALDSPTPAAPYTSWSTAATNIQDAIDAVSTPGALVLVSNGVYQTGARPVYGNLTNRVVIDKVLTLRSVNGPQFTTIRGHQVPLNEGGPNGVGAIRCVYLGDGAVLSGFTLTNGATWNDGDFLGRGNGGGGLWCESANASVSNCIISGNSAYYGGGVNGATLNNCTLSANSALYGGGAALSRMNYCTLTNNYGYHGGGAWNATLTGCTLTGNSVGGYGETAAGGGVNGGTLTNCTLIANFTTNYSGGAADATLYSCTLSNNSAWRGGGAGGCKLYNCTVAANWASDRGGGTYGGTLTQCVLNDNSAQLGGGASESLLNSCALTKNSAEFGGGTFGSLLNSCALTENSAEFGGGTFGGTLNGCTLSDNQANWAGGAYGGTLNNCTLRGNWAGWGGGAYYSTLVNCTLADNWADYYGGGAYYGSLTNCISVFNAATVGDNHWNSILNYCCTTPLPRSGLGNIASAPLFADYSGGDLRLQHNSPCINSGANTYAPPGPDLDGQPRIAGGTVDIGAYEFPSPPSVLSYAWAQQYGFPTDGSVDYSDSDSDLLNNWQECVAGTIPTDVLSALRLFSLTTDASGITVSWQSVSNRTYFLEHATNLGAQAPFSLLTSNIIGQTGVTSFTDTNAIGKGPFFYRVGVH